MALRRTLWIGGGTSAGKTSIARALAERYGLASYHVDEHELEHARRRDPSRHPAMEAWNARTLEETWVELPVADDVDGTRTVHEVRATVEEQFEPYLHRPHGA